MSFAQNGGPCKFRKGAREDKKLKQFPACGQQHNVNQLSTESYGKCLMSCQTNRVDVHSTFAFSRTYHHAPELPILRHGKQHSNALSENWKSISISYHMPRQNSITRVDLLTLGSSRKKRKGWRTKGRENFNTLWIEMNYLVTQQEKKSNKDCVNQMYSQVSLWYPHTQSKRHKWRHRCIPFQPSREHFEFVLPLQSSTIKRMTVG